MNKRHARGLRPLSFESLEPRLPLAGEVLLKVSGGTLKVTGDGEDNGVLIEQVAAGEFKISTSLVPAIATTFKLNGAAFASGTTVKNVTKDIKIDLKGDEDTVEVKGLGLAGATTARNLDIKTGAAIDTVRVLEAAFGGKVTINTGAGDTIDDGDTVLVDKVRVAKALSISTGKGDDKIDITAGQVVGNATIKTGDHEDEVFANLAQKFDKNLTINTGNANSREDGEVVFGTDTVGLEGGVIINGNTSITTGNGDDDVGLDAVTAAKVTIKTGSGEDEVSFAAETNAKVTVTQVLVNLGSGEDGVIIGSPVEDDPGTPAVDDEFELAKLVLQGPKVSKFTGGSGEDDLVGKEDLLGVNLFKDPISTGIEDVLEHPLEI